MNPQLTDSLRQLTPKQRLLLNRKIWDSSLAAFAIGACGYKETNARTHKDMIACLEGPENRKLIVMPRGTFKTSISSVAYPIWRLAQNPNLRVMLDSELYTNSKMRIREIKGHIESSVFKEVYGDWRGPVWAEGEIIIRPRTRILKEPSIMASGIGAGKTGVHVDLIIADDLNSATNSNTPEGCEKIINHFRYYTSILEPGGEIILVGTRYSAMDSIQFVIDTLLTDEQREALKLI